LVESNGRVWQTVSVHGVAEGDRNDNSIAENLGCCQGPDGNNEGGEVP
jgi:hypothetical protein